MASSAIKTPAFLAKAGNIQNEDGSSIYSNGDWSLKNSTALTSVTIKDDGKVGIGTDSPAAKLDVSSGHPLGLLLGANSGSYSRTDSTTKIARITVPHYLTAELPFSPISGISTATENRVEVGTNTSSLNATSRISFYTGSTLTGGTLATERMRIESNGNVQIKNNYLEVGENTTSSYTGVFVNGIVSAYRAISTSGGGIINVNSDYYGTNTPIFQVRSEGAIYARFTSITSLSDIRFKEDVKPLTGCLSKIMKLKPSSWKWKDGRKQETTGFIAQEIEEVFPQFVTELEESEQGIEKPKAVGAAGNEMIANLVAAIQEQQAIIEELKAKVSALEVK